MPSGDPPLGTGKAPGIFRASVFSASVLSLPSGQWPDDTGGSPVPPIPISEFGFKSRVGERRFIVALRFRTEAPVAQFKPLEMFTLIIGTGYMSGR